MPQNDTVVQTIFDCLDVINNVSHNLGSMRQAAQELGLSKMDQNLGSDISMLTEAYDRICVAVSTLIREKTEQSNQHLTDVTSLAIHLLTENASK